MTEKLFYKDSHLSEFEATVLSCEAVEDHYEIELDRTAFFPEGGGQYSDRGVLGTVVVYDVQEREDRIFHMTKEPIDQGTVLCGRIDWDERFMKMQQHTGEHIVSGIVHERFGYNNVGFHLGTEDCTMDFNGEITVEQLRQLELEINQAVWKNLPVITLYPTKEQLPQMEYRSKIEIQGQVRIIEIPGYDRCACCAPHVDRTGEIGVVKLTNVQRYKGGVRVTMLCGVRALADYNMKEKQVKEVSRLLCAKENEIAEAVEHLTEEQNNLKYEIVDREKKMIRYKAETIPSGKEPVCVFTDEFAGESMRLLMNELLEEGHILCAVFYGNEGDGYRFVMGSPSIDMRALGKEFHAQFHGRGGGKPEMIQGSVQGSEEEMTRWILEKVGNVS